MLYVFGYVVNYMIVIEHLVRVIYKKPCYIKKSCNFIELQLFLCN